MKSITKVFIAIAAISAALLLTSCPNAVGGVDYVLTMQIFIDGRPASDSEVATMKEGMELAGGSGTWFGHELKLTYEDFKELLKNTDLPADTTVEEYINEIVVELNGWGSVMGIEVTKVSSSTVKINSDSTPLPV